MLEELKKLNEKLILINQFNNKEKEKHLIIKKILNKKDFILNTNIEYVYAILRDLKIKEEDIQKVYFKLLEEEEKENNSN